MKAVKSANAQYPIKFKHKHSFFVINLREIISIKMENFHASQGVKTTWDQLFIWGSYNLIVSYLKYRQKEKMIMEKVLTKFFFYIFPFSHDYAAKEAKSKKNLICEAKYTYMITPVFLFLFPLLRKIKFIPFKVTVLVQGEINAVFINDAVLESTEKENLRKGGDPLIGGETQADEVLPQKVESPEEIKGEQKGREKVAQGKQQHSANVPIPNPQYYKTYRLFYDHFYKKK